MKTLILGIISLSAGIAHAIDYQVSTAEDEPYNGGSLDAETAIGVQKS